MIGKAWTSEEFPQLLSELKEKKTFKEIAEAHGRTENAIKFKVLFYACNKVLVEGQSQELVLEETGLTAEELQGALDRRSGKFVAVAKPVPLVKPMPLVKRTPLVKPVPLVKPMVKKATKLANLTDILAVVNSVQTLLTHYIATHGE